LPVVAPRVILAAMSDFSVPALTDDDDQTSFMQAFLREALREHARLKVLGHEPVPGRSLSGMFVVFLQAASRFDVFSFGPVSIYVPAVREVLYRGLAEGHVPGGSYTRFSVLAEEERRRSGAPSISEHHMLLAFMKIGEGLPASVFGELGITPDAVEEFARSGSAPTAQLERLYSAEEAAGYLDVHPETVREWIRSGRLRASRVAGSRKALRIKASDLAAVLEPVEARDSATTELETS